MLVLHLHDDECGVPPLAYDALAAVTYYSSKSECGGAVLIGKDSSITVYTVETEPHDISRFVWTIVASTTVRCWGTSSRMKELVPLLAHQEVAMLIRDFSL